MAKEESEFQKLLSEAPAAPDPDTLTLIGFLGRITDPARFVLTLPDGRSETLEVAAVKSAKKMASAIGQSVVELELDAKRVPERVRDGLVPGGTITAPLQDHYQTVASHDYPHTGYGDLHKLVVDDLPKTAKEVVEIPVVPDLGGVMPFVAAAPHQADPATMAALSHPTHRTQSRLHVKPPQRDQQMPPKQPYQDGTNANNPNAFDITGHGGFDVITYPDGNATYHYYYSS
jgi:hypothetical protein